MQCPPSIIHKKSLPRGCTSSYGCGNLIVSILVCYSPNSNFCDRFGVSNVWKSLEFFPDNQQHKKNISTNHLFPLSWITIFHKYGIHLLIIEAVMQQTFKTIKQSYFNWNTRLHSSRMRTACMLTVSPSMLCTGGCKVPCGCMVLAGCMDSGVCAWSWGDAWSQGGCTVQGVHGPGRCMVSGVWYPSMSWGRPPCEQNDKQV